MSYNDRSTYQSAKKVYSDEELAAFTLELEPYYETKEVAYPEKRELRVINWTRFFFDRGAMNNTGAVIMGPDGSFKYRTLSEKIHQWTVYQGRKQFGEKKRLEGLDQLVKGMSV